VALYNSWRFIGFGETCSRGIIAVEPVDCDYCYTITFYSDGTFEGWSVANKFSGKFDVSGNNIIPNLCLFQIFYLSLFS